jgi:Domain of unknown function (DUF4375)
VCWADLTTTVRDAHSEMLDLAGTLAERQAFGQPLSRPEQAMADIMWIGSQVSPNGFDGWLAYTSCERMRATLAALAEVGGTEVAGVVERALSIAGVDPKTMVDSEREGRVNAMTEEDRGRLETVDRAFHNVYEPSMELYRQYARQHHLF